MGGLNTFLAEKPIIKVLADSDLILELFINRDRFVEDAEKLIEEIAKSQNIEVYITDKCLKLIYIYLEDELGKDAASYLEGIFNKRIIKIDKSIREKARISCLRDYKSAEEVVCVKIKQLDAIVTHNPQNFNGEDIHIWSVESLLQRSFLETHLLLEHKSRLEKDTHLENIAQIKTNFAPNNQINYYFLQLQKNGVISNLRNYYSIRLRNYGLINTHDADEIIHEALLLLLKALEVDKKIVNVDNWLRIIGLRIIHNLKRIEAKHGNSYKRVLFNFYNEEELLCEQDKWDEIEIEEAHGKIHQALQNLDSKDRELLTLRFCEDLSWEKIAKRLTVDNGTQVSADLVRKRSSVVLKKLRKIFFELYAVQSL